MKVSLFALSLYASAVFADYQSVRGRRLNQKKGCLLVLNEIDSGDGVDGPEEEWVCILDEADSKAIDPNAVGGGHMLKVVGLSDEVKKNVRSGESIIFSSNATMHRSKMDCKGQRVAIGRKDEGFPECEQNYLGGMADEAVCRESKHISSGSFSGTVDDSKEFSVFDYSHRGLKTGERSVLVVRVEEVGNVRTSVPSEAKLVNDVFEDSVSLTTQYAKCSANKLRFVKAADRSSRFGGNSINDGVISFSISTPSSRGSTAMVNALISKLNSEFNVRSPTALADHIMFCGLPNQDRAYASLNGWYSVYGGSSCSSISTIMHEIGHNLGLGHSNDNGREYNDLSGIMGVSYRSDDAPEMCFNAAKNYQLGWYSDRAVVFNPSDVTWEGRIVGIADYTNPPRFDEPVVIKLNTRSSNDYYLGFNRRAAHNIGTREAINQVTVTQQSSSRFDRQSDMKAKLGAGGEYTIANFDGDSDLKIQVKSINTSARPAYAEVKISVGCLRNSDCDDGLACNGVETCNRSTNQCVPGTNTGACPLQQTLKTPLCSRCSIVNGHMWDVEAKADLEITALKYVAYSPGQQVVVYSRQGSHVGFRNSPSGWNRVATVTSPSTFSLGVAELSSPIIVPAGGRQAFYITYTGRGGTLTSRGSGSLDAITASDAYLTIYEGPAKGSPFGFNFSPSPFNGEVLYSVVKSNPVSPPRMEVNKSPDSWTQITFDDFERESGLGNFQDGGFDAGYLCDSRTAYNSQCSAIIRDGSGQDSSIVSDSFNISPYGSIRVQFMYASVDMEIGEQFLLEYRTASNSNVSSWKTGKVWTRGTDFENGSWLPANAEINGAAINGGTAMQIRLRCNASSNYDSILIDDVMVEGQ